MHERNRNMILLDYSDKGYLPIQDAVYILGQAELVIHSRYPASVLTVANKMPFFQ